MSQEVNSTQHIPKCVTCSFPLIVTGVETANMPLFLYPAMHPNQCLRSTKSAALGYTEGMEVVYFTAPLKICHSFLPLAEPCFQFHETRSDSLGLPVGLPCLRLAPRGAGPAIGSTACGIALLANAGAVHHRGCPEVSLGRV